MCFRARARRSDVFTDSWTKLALGPGKVFLNRSRASSSFSTLIVSASATSSSERVFDRSSHSEVFVEQLFCRFCRKSLSALRAAWVSDKSSFACTMETPNTPICLVFASTVASSAPTSLFLAATSSSNALTAASSVAVSSARFFDMVSPSCFRIPVMLPLCGA